jgi:hypothetical protein
MDWTVINGRSGFESDETSVYSNKNTPSAKERQDVRHFGTSCLVGESRPGWLEEHLRPEQEAEG